MTCEEIEELSGALALGAALPEEVEAARAHAATCARCSALLRRYAAAAAVLVEAVEPVEPPSGLRDRILAAARADLAVPPEETASPPFRRAAPAVAESPRLPEPAVPTVVRPGPARWFRRQLPWLAAAAVFVVAAGLGAWNMRLRDQLDERDARLAAQARAIDALAQGGQLAAFQVASPVVSGARGTVLIPRQGSPVVALEGLARPEGGHVYQLWAIRNGTPVDLGVFLPDDDGRSVVTLPDLGGAQAVAVTVEPRRVPAPSAPPVLIAPLG